MNRLMDYLEKIVISMIVVLGTWVVLAMIYTALKFFLWLGGL
jgi:hypothetical protein